MAIKTNEITQWILKTRSYTGRKLIFNGLLTIIVGIILIIQGTSGTQKIIDWVTVYFFVFGLYNLVTRLLKRKVDRSGSVSASVLQILLALGISLLNEYTQAPVHMIVILLGAYQLFMACIHFITFLLYRKDHIPKRGRYLFDAIVLGILGMSAMTDFVNDSELQFFVFGVYLLFLGISYLRDGLFFESDTEHANLKRHGRVNLPIVLVALIPNTTLRKINETLHQAAEEGETTLTAAELYNAAKNTETPDLEVFIHVTETGFGAMGHVDICYNGQVISFGSYDTFSEKLGGAIGDGVLFEVERNRYIDFCKIESNKTLFSYGLQLNEQQRQAVEARIAEIKQEVKIWQPSDRPVDPKDNTSQPMYAYRLQQETGASLYKFTRGKFKSYFVLSTNCVLLADSIIGQAGTDVLSVRGVISPGTYQDYLEREYAKPHSIVITRAVY